MGKMKQVLPGFVLVLGLAVGAKWLEGWMAPVFRLEALTIGILFAMLLNNTVQVPEASRPGIKYAHKTLLKVGIILLGFKMNVAAITELGPTATILVLAFVPFVLLLSWGLGKSFGMDKKLATLIGVGSSICGASAIVALAPSVHADDDEAVLAVSVISFLGAIGVLLYSAVATLPLLTDIQYGIWSGLSLQGVAHALAAALARGDVSGDIGTFIKMERVLMLVPMSILLSWMFRKEGAGKRAGFPMYVLGFILAGVINALGVIPVEITGLLAKASSYLILMAMVGMGLSVKFSAIREKGKEAIVMGSVLFLIIGSLGFFLSIQLF